MALAGFEKQISEGVPVFGFACLLSLFLLLLAWLQSGSDFVQNNVVSASQCLLMQLAHLQFFKFQRRHYESFVFDVLL